MKNSAIAALILALAVTLFCPAIAAAEETAGQQSTIVSYDYNGDGIHGVDTFVVTIPMAVDITQADTETDLSVEASEVYVLAGKRLLVTASSQNDFVLKTASGSAIPYSCRLQGMQIDDETEILSVKGIGLLSEATGDSVLKLSATKEDINNAKFSGAHTDVLTFTCGVELIPPEAAGDSVK